MLYLFLIVDENKKAFLRCNELKQATSRFLLRLSALLFRNVASGTSTPSVIYEFSLPELEFNVEVPNLPNLVAINAFD